MVATPSDEAAYEIVSARTFPYPRERLFDAFINPDLLVQWWGPNGFTNTFHQFELRPGGNWRFTMHGPDGRNYENHCRFVVLVRPQHIEFAHLSPPDFRMTMTFAERKGKTRLTWHMRFGLASECQQLRPIIEPCNEQNFDRLAALLARTA